LQDQLAVRQKMDVIAEIVRLAGCQIAGNTEQPFPETQRKPQRELQALSYRGNKKPLHRRGAGALEIVVTINPSS
jgi:hypothetical protein